MVYLGLPINSMVIFHGELLNTRWYRIYRGWFMTMMLMANWSVFDRPGSLSTIGRPPRESPDLFERSLAEKDSSDQQIEQIVVKGKCHASGMYILMYHNSAYISNYFQIFPTYETNTGWKLEAWGAQAISSKLVFFYSFFWRKPCHLGLRPHHSSSHIGISYPRERCCHLWHALGDFMLAWDLNLNLAFIMTSPQPD